MMADKKTDRYKTDTMEFGRHWSKWLEGKSEEYLKTPESGSAFIKHMREEFDSQNPGYTKDHGQAIISKCNYLNTQLKKNGFKALHVPSVGTPGKKKSLEDLFSNSDWAKKS